MPGRLRGGSREVSGRPAVRFRKRVGNLKRSRSSTERRPSLLSLVVVFSALLAADPGADTGSAPAPTPPLTQPPSSMPERTAETQPIYLKDAKDGTGDLVYEGNGFSARIAADGSVTFKDKQTRDVSALGFLPMQTRMPVPSLQSTLASVGQHRPLPEQPPLE